MCPRGFLSDPAPALGRLYSRHFVVIEHDHIEYLSERFVKKFIKYTKVSLRAFLMQPIN
jgi:hypothetical protein